MSEITGCGRLTNLEPEIDFVVMEDGRYCLRWAGCLYGPAKERTQLVDMNIHDGRQLLDKMLAAMVRPKEMWIPGRFVDPDDGLGPRFIPDQEESLPPVSEPEFEIPPKPLHDRVWDLVRDQRIELFRGGLISDQEYADLVARGSEGARRLETYDEMRARIAILQKELAETKAAFTLPSDQQIEMMCQNRIRELRADYHGLVEHHRQEMVALREHYECRDDPGGIARG